MVFKRLQCYNGCVIHVISLSDILCRSRAGLGPSKSEFWWIEEMRVVRVSIGNVQHGTAYLCQFHQLHQVVYLLLHFLVLQASSPLPTRGRTIAPDAETHSHTPYTPHSPTRWNIPRVHPHHLPHPCMFLRPSVVGYLSRTPGRWRPTPHWSRGRRSSWRRGRAVSSWCPSRACVYGSSSCRCGAKARIVPGFCKLSISRVTIVTEMLKH